MFVQSDLVHLERKVGIMIDFIRCSPLVSGVTK